MVFQKLKTCETEVIDRIIGSSKNEQSLLLTYLNQHCFNIYNSNSEYRNLLNNNFTVFLDGFGVYCALKFLGYRNVQNFNATDLYEKIFQQFATNQAKLFLIGGSFSEEIISEKAQEKNLSICGYQYGYFSNEEANQIIEKIKDTPTEVIVIGMEVPNQEILATKISESIQNKVILCVGGFLEFYFGTKRRAPKIFRLVGLEWLHRLIKEPGRMWKRYIIGIPLFIFQIIKLKFSSKK
jgi:N-acetylglucosaminyldiphosphoundecaprenol N-acetyl-beta-D-mannosaminyltransferase